MWPFRAAVRLAAPADEMRASATHGTIEAIDERSRRLAVGADTQPAPAFPLSLLEIDFTVESSVELARALQDVAERFQRAAGQVINRAAKSAHAT